MNKNTLYRYERLTFKKSEKMTQINSLNLFLNMNRLNTMDSVGTLSAMGSIWSGINSFVNTSVAMGQMGTFIPFQPQVPTFNFTGAQMPSMTGFMNSQMPATGTWNMPQMPSFNFNNANFTNPFTTRFSNPTIENIPSSAAFGSLTAQPARDKSETALDVAVSQLGTRENTGKNDGVQIDKYRKGKANNDPWCASFVSWCFGSGQNSDNSKTFGYDASVVSIKKKAQKQGFFASKDSYTGKKGDLAVWDFGDGTGHIGIVKSISPDSKKITVIEGNSNDAVREKTYSTDKMSINGFVKMKEWLNA